MIRLSVNVNKVALLRNTRNIGIPSVRNAAKRSVDAGAHGITVHPRPDQRHIRPSDVFAIGELLKGHPEVEFNIEGNPFQDFMDIVRKARPTQCTLVPDDPRQSTSDHGWDLTQDARKLRPVIQELKELGIRVSLFMDAESTQWDEAREIGADRVELYTEPYAAAFARNEFESALSEFITAATAAQAAGLGVNAGHDLNLQNLREFCRKVPNLLEVSIGHALIADALEMGIYSAVKSYLRVLK